jgi:glycosyltransferase involved in cell wall biosynthesis
VIHVLHVLIALGRGGAERVLTDVITHSDPARFRHTICYLHPPHDLADELRAAGCELICLDAPTRHGWLHGARALRRILDERRPDVVHSAMFEPNMTARLAAIGKHVPSQSWLVSMEYDPASVRAAGWSRSRNLARRWLDRWSARLAGTHFVACSGAVKASAVEQLGVPPAAVDVIYNPVDPATIVAAPAEVAALRRSMDLPPSAFVYLTIGRLDAPKDHATLFDAFRMVADDQPDAHLIVLGLGRLEEELRRRAVEIGLGERIHFIHSVPRTGPYFGLADAFVFPSLIEGLPVALLEAMSAGLPCIASDIPPHAELLAPGETGLLFPRGTPAALAAAMERIHSSPDLRARLGAAARAYAAGRFTIDRIVPQWEKMFEAAAARRPR